MTLTQNHLRLLKLNEGFRGRPYKDTVGKWTIGYGRNLTDVPLTEDEGAMLAVPMLMECDVRLQKQDIWVEALDPVRHAALLDMMYNLGPSRYALFKKFRASMALGDYEEAVEQLKASKWWTQVGERRDRIAHMILTGTWPW